MSNKITLVERYKLPPGGFTYREVSINWSAASHQDLGETAAQLQLARAQNPASGLDPSYEACLQAIIEFTCARLGHDPKWCGPQPEVVRISHGAPTRGIPRKCASCGR